MQSLPWFPQTFKGEEFTIPPPINHLSYLFLAFVPTEEPQMAGNGESHIT